nr:iron-containing alcohol dehydrogenase [Pseudomonas aeruginosa]
MPLIAVPTTAGTGSETTNVTVIIDAVSGRKQVLAHASLMPDVAILDAALTEGVPPHITAMTGIDALTHAVEAYSASPIMAIAPIARLSVNGVAWRAL